MSDQSILPDEKPYPGLDKCTEFWVMGGSQNMAFRFGPFTGPEVDRHIERAISEHLAITVIAQCGREIDWDLLRDCCDKAEYPEQP